MYPFSPIDVSSITGHVRHSASAQPAQCEMPVHPAPRRIPPVKVHEPAQVEEVALIPENSQVTTISRAMDHLLGAYENMRTNYQLLADLDAALFAARSVPQLLTGITAAFRENFSLDVAGLFLREDHPIARKYCDTLPGHLRCIPAENLTASEDDEAVRVNDSKGTYTGAFACARVPHAWIAPLTDNGEKIGFLALGASEAQDLKEGVDSDFVGKAARKLSGALMNAWGHEAASLKALTTDIEDVYTEVFFMEFLKKLFQQAWRRECVITVAAISWPSGEGVDDLRIKDTIRRNVRAADLCAAGEVVPIWVLYPNTTREGAQVAVERLRDLLRNEPLNCTARFGVSSFTKNAISPSSMTGAAHRALRQAQTDERSIVFAE